jgi:3-phenylpropionate/cinnamic acid dioxygenase small subunit
MIERTLTRAQVEDFLYREARLADEHQYDAWEALWTDDALYWVPANGDGYDPTREMSILIDNRRRIGTRIVQLKSGRRYAQTPPSRTRRSVTNIEIIPRALRPMDEEAPPGDVEAQANVLIVESRAGAITPSMCRVTYHLRPVGERVMMSYKKVVLINNDQAVPTMSFLI